MRFGLTWIDFKCPITPCGVHIQRVLGPAGLGWSDRDVDNGQFLLMYGNMC